MFKKMKGKKGGGRRRKGSGGSGSGSTSGGDDTSYHSSASSLVSLSGGAAAACASSSAEGGTAAAAAPSSVAAAPAGGVQNGNGNNGTTSRRRRYMAPSTSQQRQQQQQQPSIHSLVPLYLKPVLTHYHGDFFATAQTDTVLFAQCMAEGMLPIAAKTNDDDENGMTIVLPKLHRRRCVVRLTPAPSDLHLSKSTRKKAKRYEVGINQDFDAVVRGCHAQHGRNWLYEEVVDSFRSIQGRTKQRQGGEGGGEVGGGVPAMLFDPPETAQRPTGSVPVRLYSVEVYNVESGELVAGELGYSVGSIYTSLTGFTSEDSAGSVQLAVLGRRLEQCGFDLWDMGMDMDYKERLGAHGMHRADFVRLVRRVRVERPNVLLTLERQRMNCKEIFTGPPPSPMDVDKSKKKKANGDKKSKKGGGQNHTDRNHRRNGKKHPSEEAEGEDQKPRKRQGN